MAEVRETAHNFGRSGSLVGILTRASDDGDGGPDAPAVLIVNAGVIHRAGPNRMHVGLARTLAAHGVSAFRMDLPGIGDSQAMGAGAAVEDAIAALITAMDLLERRQIARRFVVFGLCSGADRAFAAACVDPRIEGVVLVDPTRIFTTWKTTSLRVIRWLTRPAAWGRLLTGRYEVGRLARHWLRRRPQPVEEDQGPELAGIPAPPSAGEVKRQAEEALKGLVDRGVRICYIITGDHRQRYNYRRQLFDAFPRIALDGMVDVYIFEGASHTLPREVDRVRLADTVRRWVQAEVGCGAPVAERARVESGAPPRT